MSSCESSGKCKSFFHGLFHGKINIIFGFIYFAFTAILGPAVLLPAKGDHRPAHTQTKNAVEDIRKGLSSGFAGVENPAMIVGPAVIGIMNHIETEKKLGTIGSAVHAHGNLESLLNIVAGVVLLMLAIPVMYKKILSILFLMGAIFHSGMLYLGIVFGVGFAFKFTIIGAISIVAALLLTGLACICGLKERKTEDAH
ncbi:MAG: hypothetical protein KAT46_06695 [Deltaproteobacteria bacterium]|nr:hypothetical protein [Deltaproteobacteria bacterium]